MSYRLTVCTFLTTCIALVCSGAEPSDPSQSSKYLDAVREFADNVLQHGRDTYGPKHTPLFVDGLNIHTHEPVKWIAPGTMNEEWILCNLASQQNLFRVLDGLTDVTGDQVYKKAAMEAIDYAFANLQSPNGLLYWGIGVAYDALGDRRIPVEPEGRLPHMLKANLPYYELMWQVNPESTRRFIESFWSAHILDWSNLNMNRIGHYEDKLEEPWKYEYDEGPIFLTSRSAMSFSNAGTDLLYAAAMLTRLSGDKEPLVWAKRLAYRYVRTRHPNTGISYYMYTKRSFLIDDSYDSVMKKLVGATTDPYLIFTFPWFFQSNPKSRANPSGEQTPTPGVTVNSPVFYWQTQFLVGDMLMGLGDEFKQWALEEFTAFGRNCYRKQDNVYVPILTDGTSIDGYIVKIPNNNLLGPKDTALKPVVVSPSDLWSYSMAYRVTRDVFMWEMSRNIAKGNGFGDIGITPQDESKLNYDADCANPYALLAFLELYRATARDEFLSMAKRIGDNVLVSRFHKGFFVASNKHTYTKFDAIDSLAVLRLHSALAGNTVELPEAWPSLPYFSSPYRWQDHAVDNKILYTCTESAEPPLSLHEAVAVNDTNLVYSLLDQGADVDDSVGTSKTPLQCAAINGNKDLVELLLDRGAGIDIQKGWPGGTPLHLAAQNGHKQIVELLLGKGADINAKWMGHPKGDTPLHSAVRAGHANVIALLIKKGADINVKGDRGGTPLHLAALRGHKEIVEFLITGGADVNVKDNRGITPLVLAQRRRRREIVEMLTKAVEEQKTEEKETSSPQLSAKEPQKNEQSVEDVTKLTNALLDAIQSNNQEKAKELIAQGADVNARDDNGEPLLLQAIRAGRLSFVEPLVSGGADVNISNSRGVPPLSLAAVKGYREVVMLLLAGGADVNIKDIRGKTPLDYAKQKGFTEVVEILTKAAQEQKATEKESPEGQAQVSQKVEQSIEQAILSSDLNRVKELISQGADVNVRDSRGNTPLLQAIRIRRLSSIERLSLVKMLISAGADLNAKNSRDQTPLGLAKRGGYTEIVELLQSQMFVHDVAVTNVAAPKSCVRGDTVPIVVSAGNRGSVSEIIKVKINDLINGKEISYKSLTLSPAYDSTLDNSWDLVLTGETSGRQGFGDWFWCGGDVNGDGYDDLLMCSAEWNNKTGRAYVYYGGEQMDNIADKIFTGENKEDRFGCWGGGYFSDMNNDGFDDVLIGARFYDSNGRVYIFYGGSDMDEKPDVIIDPPSDAKEASFGRGVCAGDLNGDGIQDLVVSAAGFDGTAVDQGRVYLYYGPVSSGVVPDKVLAPEKDKGSLFGIYPCARGDVDGDGCDDLLVGSRYYPDQNSDGRAWLFYGDPGITMDETCDIVFETDEKGDEFGSAIDLFDIDNDGHAEVLIGARHHSNKKGRVYLYWGNDRKSLDETVRLTLDGNMVGEQFGGGCVMGGYVNNDQYGDIVVAAWAYNKVQGRAYAYYGGPKTSMDTAYDNVFTPEHTRNQTHRARIADFNGDGCGDIIIGGWEYNNFQGRCWIWFGNPESSSDINFNWDTTNASVGKHTLKVEIPPVPGEQNTKDNTKTVTIEVKEPSK